MGRSLFLLLLLLFLSFGHGFGRIVLMETVEHDHSTATTEGNGGKSRVMIELMDYADPEPNTNPKNGYIFSPPASNPSPPPRG